MLGSDYSTFAVEKELLKDLKDCAFLKETTVRDLANKVLREYIQSQNWQEIASQKLINLSEWRASEKAIA